MERNHPLMSSVSELVTFIQQENPDMDELCQFAVLRTFSFLDATAIFGARLDTDGTISPTGQFGFSPEVMKSWDKTHISDSFPTTDALKTNNIVWVADVADLEHDYPQLVGFKLELTTKTFVAWPITIAGSYMSVLGLCLSRIESPTPELISFFETVGGLFALQLSKKGASGAITLNDKLIAQINLFTRRQRGIIHLMAEGLTNTQIGNELGFSESTIRQETMRIYEILGATGRADAIRMYRNLSTS